MTTDTKTEISVSAVKKSLEDFFVALNSLRATGITNSKHDFTCQIGEWLTAVLYGGERATIANQRDWDVKSGETYYQVKAHAKAEKNTARTSSVKHREHAQTDFLVIVVFTFDYKLKEFYKIPWQDALPKITVTSKKSYLRWNKVKDYRIPIDELPQQEWVALFR